MPDITALNELLDELRQLEAVVNGMPLQDRIRHLQQIQKAKDEFELRKRVLNRLEQAKVTLGEGEGPVAWRWILQSLWKEANTVDSIFSEPPPLPVNLPDLLTAEQALAELEAWVHDAPYGFPFIPGVQAPSPCASSSLRPHERMEGAPPVVARPSNQACVANGGLTFLPGAFVYRGHEQRLGGKPLEVLKALAAAPRMTLTLRALQDKVWPDCITGEETVRWAVMVARKALRRAMSAALVKGPADPIPVVDRGMNRTAWRLDLP